MAAVLEIVVRLGDSILEVAHVPHGRAYRIGTGSDVQLAVGIAKSFPLIDEGGHVRIPVGVSASRDGAPVTGELRLASGERLELAIALLAITIRRTELACASVPRPRVGRRLPAYLVASLAAHLTLWALAIMLAPAPLAAPEPVRLVRIRHVPKAAPVPVPPKPVPTQKAPAASASATAPRVAERTTPKPPSGGERRPTKVHASMAEAAQESVASVVGEMQNIDVVRKLGELTGPTYDPEATDPNSFGGGRRFDADAVAPKETYKVTGWDLPTFIHAPGELAPVPVIEMCDDDSCLVRGPLQLATVLSILGKHRDEIARCYREHTGDLVGQIRMRFVVSTDGKVHGTVGTHEGPVGYGTGTVGRCVVKIAARLKWPKPSAETWVFVGMAFRPA